MLPGIRARPKEIEDERDTEEDQERRTGTFRGDILGIAGDYGRRQLHLSRWVWHSLAELAGATDLLPATQSAAATNSEELVFQGHSSVAERYVSAAGIGLERMGLSIRCRGRPGQSSKESLVLGPRWVVQSGGCRSFFPERRKIMDLQPVSKSELQAVEGGGSSNNNQSNGSNNSSQHSSLSHDVGAGALAGGGVGALIGGSLGAAIGAVAGAIVGAVEHFLE
jgi:hypothetical protein